MLVHDRHDGMAAMASGEGTGDLEPVHASEVDSGTGWPQGDTALHAYKPSTRTTGGQSRTAQLPVAPSVEGDRGSGTTRRVDPDDDYRPRRRRWVPFGGLGRRMFWLAMVAGVIVVLLLITTIGGFWPNLTNPFKSKTTDRSGPVLLVSIQDLARFEAASGNFQVIVDLQQDKQFIPDFLFNKRELFVAAGTVNAYVDFSQIATGDLVISKTDPKNITVNLPAAQLEPPTLDLDRTYLYATQEGIINKLGDFFGNNANDEQQLYQLAQQKIAAAALDSQLTQRAETNTKGMLTDLLKSLGFTTITVTFPANP
jgi:hypothetical protein